MRRGWWVAAGMCWLACSEKAGPDAGTPAEQEAALVQRVARCAEHVPAEVRAAVLPGWEESAPSTFEGAVLFTCAFKKPGASARVTTVFDCQRRPSDRQLERMREALLDQGGADVPGLARAAVRAKGREGLDQITAWDSDSDCSVTATWLGEGHEQTPELVRRLLAGYPAAAEAGAPDAGEPPDAG